MFMERKDWRGKQVEELPAYPPQTPAPSHSLPLNVPPILSFRKQRPKKSFDTEEADPFLATAREEHHMKMRILQLKQWKLRHDCMAWNIGLPPNYDLHTDSDFS